MRIHFFCPTCHQPLSADGFYSGNEIVCPTCKESLSIPEEESCAADSLPTPDVPSSSKLDRRSSLRRQRRWRRVIAAVSLLLLFLAIGAAFPTAYLANAFHTRSGAWGGTPQQTATGPQTPPADKLVSALQGKEGEASRVGETHPTSTSEDPLEPDGMEDDQPPPAPAKAEPAKPPLAQATLTTEPRPQPAPPNQDTAQPVAKPQPPQAEKRVTGTVRQRWANNRRSRLTDVELRAQLLQPPEVDLESVPGTIQRVIAISGRLARIGIDVIPQLAAQRVDLFGLPFHESSLTRIGPEEAFNLKVLAQRLRSQVQASIPGKVYGVVDPRPDANLLRQRLLANPQAVLWLRPQAIATLRQLLMHEHRNVRLVYVDVLSQIEGKQASVALAERAIFDLDPDVRLAALQALKSRSVGEYASTLTAALRYPWPAFADHAAEALVALDVRDAVPDLIKMLDARDIAEPYPVNQGKARWAMVPELVRVNHLRNCLLCHAYSSSPADPVRGLVPNAEHLVPVPSVTLGGYGGGSSSSDSGLSIIKLTFIRADVNFLRQDFSITQPVPNHGTMWPADQRYDYLLRLRPISSRQLLTWQDRMKDYQPPELQRESLLFALRALTGENPGPTADDWKRRYSTLTGRRFEKPLEPKDQLLHLRDSLVDAAPPLQAERLKAFRDKSGAGYDTALALAIPHLRAELQASARSILVDRLFCFSLARLSERLGDKDEEIRRAAVMVARQRHLKPLVPQLIDLLDDPNPELAKQVHDVLRQLTSHDFGPKRGADHDKRLEAMAAWRAWWDKRSDQLASQKR